MTSTAPWLSRQRKSDLVEMADNAGMTNFKNLKKSDLEEEVDNFLRANQTTLSANPKLADFYKRVKDGSPVAAGKELVKSETKTPSKVRRRTIAPKDDVVSDSETPNDSSLLRTPGRQTLGVASNIPLPPSPAVIAQEIDRQTARLSTWANQKYAKTGVQAYVEKVRDTVSTSAAVNTIFWTVEVYNLLRVELPNKSLGLAVPLSSLGFSDYHLMAPQFWNLLEAHFWTTLFLWSAVSLILPGAAAYLFNLPLKVKRHGKAASSKFDPFIFNVAKAVITWVVFVQAVDLPTIGLKSARLSVAKDIPGGYVWLMVSSGIGALVALYEAILRH